MVAYQNYAAGETPSDVGMKSDHFVFGKYYVRFDKAFNEEYGNYVENAEQALGKDDYFNSDLSALGMQTRDMLRAWEAEEPDVRALWAKMNQWCEDGFDETYERMGVGFERIYHESQTYLLGKDLVADGLERGVFHRADNGAAVFDLEKIGLQGEKAVLPGPTAPVFM